MGRFFDALAELTGSEDVAMEPMIANQNEQEARQRCHIMTNI